VELIDKDMPHNGKDGLAGWIKTTWLPYLERVPPQRKEQFIEDIVAAYLRDHPLDDEGIAHVKMKRLEVEAVKPQRLTRCYGETYK
jgi:trans-aconitate methyltransferase